MAGQTLRICSNFIKMHQELLKTLTQSRLKHQRLLWQRRCPQARELRAWSSTQTSVSYRIQNVSHSSLSFFFFLCCKFKLELFFFLFFFVVLFICVDLSEVHLFLAELTFFLLFFIHWEPFVQKSPVCLVVQADCILERGWVGVFPSVYTVELSIRIFHTSLTSITSKYYT